MLALIRRQITNLRVAVLFCLAVLSVLRSTLRLCAGFEIPLRLITLEDPTVTGH